MNGDVSIANTGFWVSDKKIGHVKCESLCNWIAEFLKEDKEKHLYDFGCGNGHYLKSLNEHGFSKLTGFEGNIPQQKEFINIQKQDLTIPFSLPEKGNCLFLEVAEHVPSCFEENLLKNVIGACDGKLIMSWAIRGQPGWGHVNCLDNHEVITKLEDLGMKFLQKETETVRSSIPTGDVCWWFKSTTLVFESK